MSAKLICFDFDDTLTTSNSWYLLNTALGITPDEDYTMYTEYKNGQISYSDWTKKIEKLYITRGLDTKQHICDTLQSIQMKDDAQFVISELQKRGYDIAIISGSFDIAIKHAASKLNVKIYSAGTSIHFDDKNYFSHFKNNGEEASSKLNELTNIFKNMKIQITDCVCVGDGANDLELFKATKNGICFTDGTSEIKSA